MKPPGRRRFLIAGASIVAASSGWAAERQESGGEKEVEAAEDLMREHGVLRRALLVYAEAADRLRHGQQSIPLDALARTAQLFRDFGENYHERELEEKRVFPTVAKAKGPAASMPAILKAQHDRGRQITDYILGFARSAPGAAAAKTATADIMRSFVRMYEHHTAIEDTVVFPAWKNAVSKSAYRELSEEFEAIEHKMFGNDGFDEAVKKISVIEQAFDLFDLRKLTAPAPPAL